MKREAAVEIAKLMLSSYEAKNDTKFVSNGFYTKKNGLQVAVASEPAIHWLLTATEVKALKRLIRKS